jgi:hypothetical protein
MNMATNVIDRLFLVVFGTTDPSDEEWRIHLDLVQRHGIDRTMYLICTDGGGPSGAQRRDLNDSLAGRTVPVAVLSGSAHVRRMVMVLGWFNRKIRVFPPSGLGDATAYLEIPRSRTDLIEREINKLRLQLGLEEMPPMLGVGEASEI